VDRSNSPCLARLVAEFCLANTLEVRPEHSHEAQRQHAGIATHAHAKKFPLGLTEKEKLRGLWG
jgi:hypothetical protein